MSADSETLAEFTERVREFAVEREWSQFHDPKNLTMALSAEVGELTALFQWLTPEESRLLPRELGRRQRVEDELADVLIYLVRLADVLEIDLVAVGRAKLERNAERYPVELAKGSAAKYDELHQRRTPGP